MLAVAVPAVAAQEEPGDNEVNVFLEAIAEEDDSATYELLVEDADEGIGAYEINVSTGDTTVGTITDYELTGNSSLDGSRITDDNETLALEVALGGSAHDANETAGQEFAIATVEVTAQETPLEDSTNLTVTPVVEGEEIAKPEVQGEGEDFYDVLNLPSSTPYPPVQTEVDLALAPDPLQSPPGEAATYTVTVDGATEGLGSYDLTLAIDDPDVAQFTATESPVIELNETVGEAGEQTVVDTVEITATGDISDTTTVNITGDPGPGLWEADGDKYLVDGITGSEFLVTADMDLQFRDQRYGDAVGGAAVTVRDVDSDAQQGTVLVTYEDGNETVVAGLTSGMWDGEDVTVTVEDFGGFSETPDGPAGEHTAHILLADDLSSDYEPGDVLSAGTADSVIEQETATVTQPTVPELSGLDIAVTDGLTIGDEYPLNQRAMFAQAGSIYGLSGIDLPAGAAEEDERFAPIADGQHVGLGGLPVQDELYQWATPLVGFQSFAPTQTVAVSFEGDESSPVSFDYSEAQAHGLRVAEVLTVAGDNIEADEYNWTLDSAAGEIVVEFDESAVGPESPTVLFELVWAASDPIEGLDVDEPNGIDYETDHRVVAPDADQVRDNFVTFEAGATGISHADTNNANDGFLGQPADEVELESFVDTEGAADGTSNDGSFLVWQNQRVTFETAASGDTVEIFETAVDENGNYTLGEQVDEEVLGFDDTAPGQVANLNTSNLTAGQQYFVTFGENTTEAVVLDVRPLNIAAGSADTVAVDERDDPLEIAVTSEDTTGGDVEAWFVREPDNDTEDVVHVERNKLTGEGDRVMEVVPSVDLAGPGTYTATVLHAESGVTTTTEFTVESPADDEPVLDEAEDVNIGLPALEEPGVTIFDRGDIMPVELELVGGNVATVTFGDEGGQNVEVHATVYDPQYDEADVDNNSDTTVTVYLNTYQIGHGYVAGESDGLVPNRPNWIPPGDWENRQHGFFTNPGDDGSALVPASSLDRAHNVYAAGGMDIYGGSQGGAVISPGTASDGEYPGLRYDLHAASGVEPHTAPGSDRDDVNAVGIEQRSTTGFDIWTAPGEGENALHAQNLTTMDTVESLKEQGILTELVVEEVDVEDGTRLVYNGTIAENDYLVVEADSSGLEGVMHEAVVRNSSLGVEAFLNRSDDHLLTEEFAAAVNQTLPRLGDSLLDYSVQVFENTTSYADRIEEPEENVERFEPDQVVLDLAGEMERVLGGVDADGNLQEYVVPYQLEPGDELLDDTLVDPELATLEGGLTFDTGLALEPSGGEQAGVDDTWNDRNVPTMVNPSLANGSLGLQEIDEFDYATPAVRLGDVHTGQDGSQLQVPRVDSYTISGTATMAPGTLVDVVLLSETDEATPFLKTASEVRLTEQADSTRSAWEATFDFSETRDDVEIVGGTIFEADVTRSGGGSLRGGEDIPGVVLEDPAVESFAFNDQRQDGAFVSVEAFESNRAARITIQDASGTTLGTSDVLARNVRHEQFNIPLDESVSSNQVVTAVAEFVQPDPAQFNDTVLQEETAEILVEDESEAFFSVTDLSPSSATVQPGDVVEVSATVENLGDLEDQQTVQLDIDGISRQEIVTLAGGTSRTVTFTVDTADVAPGGYTHTVSSDDSSAAGGLTVEAPPDPAAFEIVSLSPSSATATVGDTVTVDVAVQNTGDQEGTETVTLTVDGTEQTQELTLAGGDAGSVSFDVPTSELSAGDYTHTAAVGNASVEGSLTLEAQMPEDDTSGDDSTNNTTDDGSSDDGSGPGFGIVVAALAVLGAALLAMRRQVE